MNLYDKYKNTDWHQLWADDDFAAVLRPGSYNKARFVVVTDTGRVQTESREMPLSEAFDDWNYEINQHLAKQRA